MRGNGRVFQRGQIWWVSYYHDGREHRESSKSRQRKDAIRLLRQRIGDIAAGTFRPLPASGRTATRPVTVHDLLDLLEYNYRLNNRLGKSNATYLKRLRQRFTSYTVHACTGLAISHYMDAMQRAGRKASTINREIAVLRSAFRLGYRHDIVGRVPAIKLLPDYSVRNEFFTRVEIDALLPYLPNYLRDVVLFGFLTGWRKGEIASLKWANVNPRGCGDPVGAGAKQRAHSAGSGLAGRIDGTHRATLARPKSRSDAGTTRIPPRWPPSGRFPPLLACGLP